MAATNRQSNGEYSKKSGQPFDIVEPTKEEAKPGDRGVEQDVPRWRYLGFIKSLVPPIPRLKELLERIFPSD